MLICVTISNKCPLRNWNFNGRTSKTNRFIKLFKNETKNKKQKKNEENVDRSFKNETSPRQIKLHRKKQRNLTNCFFFTVSLSLSLSLSLSANQVSEVWPLDEAPSLEKHSTTSRNLRNSKSSRSSTSSSVNPVRQLTIGWIGLSQSTRN